MTYALDLDALLSARVAKGVTQTELGVAIGGVRASRISAWELGQETPHPHQIRRLATVLGVPITDMLEPVSDQQHDLRRLRIEAGLSIKELAEQVHVAGSTLKRWEWGIVKGLATRAPVGELAVALGVEEDTVTAALQRTNIG